MKIDESAPVRGRATATIPAPADRVWDLLAGIGEWPRWNHEVARVTITQPAEPGTTFRWRAGRSTVVSTLREVDAPHRLAWTGRSLGVSAVHTWTLGADGDRTTVVTEESMSGLLARILRGPMQRLLDRSLEAWLDALAAEAGAADQGRRD